MSGTTENMAGAIVVLAEHLEGVLAPVSLEAAAWARQLSGLTGLTASAVIVGQKAAVPGKTLAVETGLDVLAVEISGPAGYNREALTSALGSLFADNMPAYIITGHTTTGMDFAPGLAVRVGGTALPGLEGVEWIDDHPEFPRPGYGGKVTFRVRPKGSPVVLMFQPGTIKPEKAEEEGRLTEITLDIRPERTQNMPTEGPSGPAASDITEADVIVAAGRGIGKKENLAVVERLVEALPRSALAASRPLCDLGWVEYRRQVGLTGQSVAPKLYIACGISGARQHLMGMRQSRLVAAVNTDPHAPIFDEADIGVVEDLNTFIPLLVEAIGSGD